jgi:distribution and morphology protein 34
LSPFTRNHEHFAARSSPHVLNRLAGTAPLGTAHIGRFNSFAGANLGDQSGAPVPGTPGGEGGLIKATRKRLYRVGTASTVHQQQQQQQQVDGQELETPDRPGAGLRGMSYGRSSSTPPGTGRSGLGGGASRVKVNSGSGAGSRSAGGTRAPSELSDYFPSSVPDALASFRRRMAAASSGAL